MGAAASQITSLTIVYSTVYSGAEQWKHQSSVSLAFVRGIHRGPVNSPHKWPVTRKMFPFDDVIMVISNVQISNTIWIKYQHRMNIKDIEIDGKSTLYQVMAWCRQATSHHLSLCCPRSMSHLSSLGHSELSMISLVVAYWLSSQVAAFTNCQPNNNVDKYDHGVIANSIGLIFGNGLNLSFFSIYIFKCFLLTDACILIKIPWWRYWPFVRGIHRLPGNSPHKGPVTRALMFSWYGSV